MSGDKITSWSLHFWKKQEKPNFNLQKLRSEEKINYIYNNYYKSMVKIAYEKLYDWDLAQDAVHDAFIVLIKKIEDIVLEDCHKMPPLIGIIVKGKAIDILRKNKRIISVESPQEFIEQQTEGDNSIDDSGLNYYWSLVKPEEADLLKMRIIDEMEYAEIAKELSISESTARKRLERAKKKLKDRIEKEGNKK